MDLQNPTKIQSVEPDRHSLLSAVEGLHGKVALVTGGTSGIGRATALALATSGAKVVFAGRRESEGASVQAVISAAGGEARFVRADVAVEAEIQALVRETVATYGRLDLAFNNAGLDILGPLTDVTEADYRQLFEVNLWGVMAAMKHEITEMLKTGGGAIVNTSSVAGHVGAANFSLYAASKHAVEGLTKTAALEYARYGIRVNSVAPAFIATAMVDRLVGDSIEQREGLAALIPAGRIGTVEDVSNAVLFLLSDAAAFITGDSLRIDGGWVAQ
jgi:NAD(P)-dependent dehydrogenase (short-subunit alcohol dehydrogenase family)